jgi:hypothetical protein
LCHASTTDTRQTDAEKNFERMASSSKMKLHP